MGGYISPEPGTIWRYVGPDRSLKGKLGIIKYADTRPGCNGDGDVEILYSQGTRFYTKVRRVENNHVYVKDGLRSRS